MTFDEKMDKAEKLFAFRKKFGFMKVEYGFIASLFGVVLFIMGFDYAATIVLLTSTTISLIGITLDTVGHRACMKGFTLLENCGKDFNEAIDGDELRRRLARHREVLNSL